MFEYSCVLRIVRISYNSDVWSDLWGFYNVYVSSEYLNIHVSYELWEYHNIYEMCENIWISMLSENIHIYVSSDSWEYSCVARHVACICDIHIFVTHIYFWQTNICDIHIFVENIYLSPARHVCDMSTYMWHTHMWHTYIYVHRDMSRGWHVNMSVTCLHICDIYIFDIHIDMYIETCLAGDKNILLIVQYKYLKSCSGDFCYSQDLSHVRNMCTCVKYIHIVCTWQMCISVTYIHSVMSHMSESRHMWVLTWHTYSVSRHIWVSLFTYSVSRHI